LPRQVVLNKIGKALPELIAGSADLAASNLTNLKVRSPREASASGSRPAVIPPLAGGGG
jgi:transketolase